jgi:hypothetical protein
MSAVSAKSIMAETAARLRSSLLLFTCYFYKLKNGRDFVISRPIGRRSHHVVIAEELEKCFYLESNRLIIAIPPGYAKTTWLIYFMAWCYSNYPDCQFIYISFSSERALAATKECRDIVAMRQFRELFGVFINPDARAASHWETNFGGVCCAFGAQGGITGANGGLLHPQDRFTGAVLCDDMLKPDQAHGSACEKVIRNYHETIMQRPRNPFVPTILIGQCIHEADLIAHLRKNGDGYAWREVIFAGLDAAGNALDPEKHSVSALEIMRETSPYVFWAQIQQSPIPAGGALFPNKYFPLLDEEPNILYSFITVDTAETEKEYNDATAFSFFGLYKILIEGRETGKWGLHWIDCAEIRVKPNLLEGAFMSFLGDCYKYKCPPKSTWIETKSTGVTLYSVLKDTRGLNIREIKREPNFCKSDRFVSIEGTVGQQLVSLPLGGKHTQMCLDHMAKITANNTHRHDDIGDTLCDGVWIGLIDKTITSSLSNEVSDSISSEISKRISQTSIIRGRVNHGLNRR